MTALDSLQDLVIVALGVAALAMEIFAFVDALRRPGPAYAYAGKLTKPVWCGILGVGVAIGFVKMFSVLDIGLIAIVAAGVYLVDARPALKQFRPRKSGGTSGPYGSW